MKHIITTPNGNPYMAVEVDSDSLNLVLLTYHPDWTISVDKKVIPKLIEILKESLNETT